VPLPLKPRRAFRSTSSAHSWRADLLCAIPCVRSRTCAGVCGGVRECVCARACTRVRACLRVSRELSNARVCASRLPLSSYACLYHRTRACSCTNSCSGRLRESDGAGACCLAQMDLVLRTRARADPSEVAVVRSHDAPFAAATDRPIRPAAAAAATDCAVRKALSTPISAYACVYSCARTRARALVRVHARERTCMFVRACTRCTRTRCVLMADAQSSVVTSELPRTAAASSLWPQHPSTAHDTVQRVATQ
jgi:hypothetical protein